MEQRVKVAAGQAAPPKPKLARPAPRAPIAADGGPGAPANLFNGMVASLIPYAIKGVIWYQGEGNGSSAAQGHEYGTLFPRMISDWREKWAQGDFPFLFVQLPNINGVARTPSQDKCCRFQRPNSKPGGRSIRLGPKSAGRFV
jgi:sialate O-acetylesterase